MGTKQRTGLSPVDFGDQPDPMCWLAVQLEMVPPEEWREPMPHHPNWRKQERAKFRKAATPRERYWVHKLHSLWPKGWNSQYPGKPAAAGRIPRPSTQAEKQNTGTQPAKDLRAAEAAIEQWRASPAAAQGWLCGASREDLAEIREGLEKEIRPSA